MSFPLPILSFQKYLFSLEIASPTLLQPYKGSAFHGGITSSFQRAVCVMPHGKCGECPLTDNCSYYSLFCSHSGASGRSVPHAYVLQPPSTLRRAFDVGDELSFSVILIGKATSLWKLLIFAVKRLGETSGIGRRIDGKRGRYVLTNVDSIGMNGHRRQVYSREHDFHHESPITITSDEFVDCSSYAKQSEGTAVDKQNDSPMTQLRFLTPVRFIKDEPEQKKLVAKLGGDFFLRSLLRRLGDLSEAYCGGSRIDFQLFSTQAADVETDKSVLSWQDWERYSKRQKERIKLGGLVGFLSLEGEVEPFIPYLRLGEWLHVGKNATFGLGQYQLILNPCP